MRGCRRRILALASVVLTGIALGVGASRAAPVRLEPDRSSAWSVEDEAAVEAILARAADPAAVDDARLELRAALGERRAGNLARAVELFVAAARDSPLGDWAALLAAETMAESGMEGRVRALLQGVPRDLTAIRGWRAITRVRLVAGEPLPAAAAALASLPILPSGRDSSAAFLEAGRALLSVPDHRPGARRFLLEAIRSSPEGPSAARARELLGVGERWSTVHSVPRPCLAEGLAHGEPRAARPAQDHVDRVAQGAAARIRALDRLGLVEAADLERARVRRIVMRLPSGTRSLADAMRRQRSDCGAAGQTRRS